MDVENKQQKSVYKKINTDAQNETILNQLLRKYDDNRNTEVVRKKRFQDISNKPVTIPRDRFGKILQKYSLHYGTNMTCNRTRDFDEGENYNAYKIDTAQDEGLYYESAYSNSSKNIQNTAANLAQLKNRVTFQDYDDNNKNDSCNKSFAEKTTYCRPIHNLYNQELIYKTTERNAKLQQLLKKLVIARRREKEKEEWNNYVNELKNKHSYYSNEPRHIAPQYVPPQESIFIESDDIYSTNQYTPCRSLLHDIYGYNTLPTYEYYYPSEQERVYQSPKFRHVFENEPSCFPTLSQGQIMRLQRERACRDRICHGVPSRRNIHKPRFVVVSRDLQEGSLEFESEDCTSTEWKNRFKRRKFKNKKTCVIGTETDSYIRDADVQTDTAVSRVEVTTKEKYEKVTENVNRLKAKIESNEHKMQRNNSLRNIESKLDLLVRSIRNFMEDLKGKNSSTSASSTNLNDSKPKSEKPTSVVIVGHAETNTSKSAFQTYSNKLLHFNSTTRINNILGEELDKSNKIRKEIEEILSAQTDRPRAVQITFDIPTRECATEVTDSLSRAVLSEGDKRVTIEEVRSHDRQITIAVNTDPMGLLALFRVSSEAIKQLISYVPNVDYSWYLSRLPLPQLTVNGGTDYVCNICGAAFALPSQLSDHIQRHNLGNSKNCCVCRHALDVPRPRGLFTCQYCGQRFTRAYCCELHQQSCARALGKRHDIASSLILLR